MRRVGGQKRKGVSGGEKLVWCIIPLYKGKGYKCEYSNLSGISLLSVVAKLYGRGLIKRDGA